ncbi:MAG TPA: protein kinase [Solirubrobacter sp.]|nr:protein kinase [Solirubrobacter sp.]
MDRGTLRPGDVIADCEIVRLIGSGGMAAVFLARHRTLQRDVAIKVITADATTPPEWRTRFAREQRIAAAIDHPNVIPIYAAGEEEERLYLVMRYVDGPDLGAVVRNEGALALERAIPIIRQVAAGLDGAHVRGLIHRDIKPENVLLDGDHVYITDFGIAKIVGHLDTTSTAEGALLGTPAFMAPEQATGQPVTPATDLYALAALTYFVLTGAPPFVRDTAMATVLAHVSEPPPIASEVAPSVPYEVSLVIVEALDKDPGRRHPSAGAFAQALEAAAEGGSYAAATPVQPVTLGPPPLPDDDISRTIVVDGGPLTVRIPLQERFRYVHQPLVDDDQPIPMLGNEEAVDALVHRIARSEGGSFLITGFRGVGKTTIIARALRQLKALDGDVSFVPVTLNVARPKTVEVLLFEVIRRVFETLKDEGLFDRMSAHVQRELILAYWRTSMSFSETRSKATERGGGLSLGAPALLEALGPKLELSRKTTNSLATQASFLAYTEADVEHDFLRILDLLDRPDTNRSRRRRRRDPPPWHGKLVVVVDELDKLTEQENGMQFIEEILSGLKNLLTAPGVHFLFVAGPDLHDTALRASRRGNSVYESVFAWQLYVPCLWRATDRLLDAVVAPEARGHPLLRSFADYLTFKSRGVPRLLVMELNSFVRFTDGRPEIVIGPDDLARVEFYAALDRSLAEFVHGETAKAPGTIRLDDDRWRLGAYYLTDWILASDGTFTVDDLVQSEARANLDPLLSLSPRKVTGLLEHLARHEIVERVGGRSSDQTFYGDAPDAQASSYRLHPEVERKLSLFAARNERERADLAAVDGRPVGATPWRDTGTGRVVGAGRYELVEELDRGGLGRVYRARAQLNHEEVAIKLFDLSDVPGGEVMRARVRRKAQIALAIAHPNIVRTHEAFEDDDGRTLGIVMDLLHGTPLAQMLSAVKLGGREAVALARPLAEALAYVDTRGVARLDLKPSSILIVEQQKPVILDLGLAKVMRESSIDARRTATLAPAILGTPAYASPEQLRGEPADIRSDIYTLGLILYEMLAHRPARHGELPEILRSANAPIDTSQLRCSDELRACVDRMVAPSPDARFATPAEVAQALAATPEA